MNPLEWVCSNCRQTNKLDFHNQPPAPCTECGGTTAINQHDETIKEVQRIADNGKKGVHIDESPSLLPVEPKVTEGAEEGQQVVRVNLHENREFSLQEYRAIYVQKIKNDPVAVDWDEVGKEIATPFLEMSPEEKESHILFLERALKAIKITRKAVWDAWQSDLENATEEERVRLRILDRTRRAEGNKKPDAAPTKSRPRATKELSAEDRIQRMIESQMALFSCSREEAEKFVRGKIAAQEAKKAAEAK